MIRATAFGKSWKFAPLALALLTTSSSPSAATWPSIGCAATLQACVDAAAAGEVVEIASNGPIDEEIVIAAKSLTLRAAAGFAPVFASSNSISAGGGNAAVTVVVEGLTVSRLSAGHGDQGAFDITFRDNVVVAPPGSSFAVAMQTTSALAGPVHFDISGNRITVEGNGDQLSAISIAFETDASGRVTGNVLRQTGSSTQGALIDINSSGSALTVDVIGNDLGSEGFPSGISLFENGAAGSMTTRIVNNLVRGAGSGGGIRLYSSAGAISAIVVNNTVANGVTGITASANPGASLGGVLANNIVAGNSGFGIRIDAIPEVTFPNDHNLVFGNGSDEEYTPGPGTVFADPQFVGPTDFHLQTSSPARNAGDTSDVPADVTVDLDGFPRSQGAAVDIGAYESAPSGVEVPALGPLGVLLLVGALCAAGLTRMRRRSA